MDDFGDYLRLFVIIDAFGVKRCFLWLYVIICGYLWLLMIICDYLWLFIGAKRWFFSLKISLLSLVVWLSGWATQNDKTRNLRFYDLRILGYKKLQNKNLRY